MKACDVVEQTHPKGGERFVIKIDQMITGGELEKLLAHARQRLVQRQSVEVA
jgi:hypothetical protein